MKKPFWMLLILALLSTFAGARAEPLQEPELLEADQAFALHTRVRDAQTLEASWKIAPDYYVYRDKFKFEVVSGNVTLQPARFPAGKKKQDVTFGDVEIYTRSVKVLLPIVRSDPARQDVVLRLTVQGCNEAVGVCYPPHTKDVTFTLPATKALKTAAATTPVPTAAPSVAPSANNAPASEAPRPLGGLSSLIAGSSEPVNPEQAFTIALVARDAQNVNARVTIADCCYLYRDKVRVELHAADGDPLPAGIALSPVTLPPGEVKQDEFIGKTEVYHHGFDVPLTVTGRTGSGPALQISVHYQGCSDKGVTICYPPMSKQFLWQASGEIVAVGGDQPGPAATATSGAPLSEQDALAQRLASGNTIVTILAFFGFGLLLAFTPCVFPMIPILSGIVVGQGKNLSTTSAFFLSLAYVLAMAATYTVAGVLAGLFGANLQVWFQNVWVLSIFAAVFVLLSLSMFGFYELQMPSAIQSRLTEVSNRQQGGSLIGAAIMGLLSALIVGPCVTAPLVGALIYIGQTGDAVLGGGALFALSLGMGAPLLVIGTSAGKLLPRAGGWMDTVKAVFGVMLLGVALWLLERVLPAAVTMALAAALLIASGVYMGALDGVPAGASGWRRLWKALGLVVVTYGAALFIGALSGSEDFLQPLKGVRSDTTPSATGATAAADTAELHFRRIKGPTGLDQALAEAKAQGKPVVLDFYADWCVSCKEMEKNTFRDPAVHAALSHAVLLQSDVTANDADDTALLKRYKLVGPPAILFFDARGSELSRSRVVGYMPAEKFAAHVHAAIGQPGT